MFPTAAKYIPRGLHENLTRPSPSGSDGMLKSSFCRAEGWGWKGEGGKQTRSRFCPPGRIRALHVRRCADMLDLFCFEAGCGRTTGKGCAAQGSQGSYAPWLPDAPTVKTLRYLQQLTLRQAARLSMSAITAVRDPFHKYDPTTGALNHPTKANDDNRFDNRRKT